MLSGLKRICAGAEWVTEGGKDYVLLPGLKVLTNGASVEMDGLLRPGEHNGYKTRLFVSEPLPGKGNGGAWSVHTICGRTWHTWSWNNVPEDIPLVQMLMGHLMALR